MWRHEYGVTRHTLRQGGGTDIEPEHYDEVLGSTEFFIYVTPNRRPKGYEALKGYLESLHCTVEFPADSPLRPGERYQVVKVTTGGAEIPPSALRRSHRWAHQRNFLHHFFRPLAKP